MPLSEDAKKFSDELFTSLVNSSEKLRKKPKEVPSALLPLVEQLINKRGPATPDLGFVDVQGRARAEALRRAFEWEGQKLTDATVEEIIQAVIAHMLQISGARIAGFELELELWRQRTGANDSNFPAIIAELNRERQRVIAETAQDVRNDLNIRMYEARQASGATTRGAVKPASSYEYHPEILKVSDTLFRQGNYRQAVLDAFIHVIHLVKQKTGLPHEGDDLMNQAFSAKRGTPMVRFNDFKTDADKDEQQGIYFLFKGVVGLRNFKAHVVATFDDPQRAHEYLALASLLMRLLDSAVIEKPAQPPFSAGQTTI